MRSIERLTVDIHQCEARTMDYIDTKLDAQLDDIRHVWANYKSSSSSSSSRRRRSSRKSSLRPRDASTTRHRHHLRGDRQDHEERPSGRELASLPPPCTRALDPRAQGTLCPRPHAPLCARALHNSTIDPKAAASKKLSHLRLWTYDIFAYFPREIGRAHV